MGFLDRLGRRGGNDPAPRTAIQDGEPFHLDDPLLQFSPLDAWTLRDACEGVQIFGGIGSGKTTGSGAALARAFLAYGFGGLVCCAKPDERRVWEHYARETGRSDDLIIFSPEQPWRFNFLEYELRRQGRGGGQTENLVSLFAAVREIAEGKKESGGENPFFDRAVSSLLRNAIDLFSLSGRRLTHADLCALVLQAPQSREQISDATWQKTSVCAQVVDAAHKAAKSPMQEQDFETSTRYWLSEWPQMDNRTRSNIVATFNSVADMLLHGDARELFCTDTNLVPEVSYKNGRVIILDIPVQEYDEMGRIAQGIFKYLWQRALLRRLPQLPRSTQNPSPSTARRSRRRLLLFSLLWPRCSRKSQHRRRAMTSTSRAPLVHATGRLSSLCARPSASDFMKVPRSGEG